MSAPPVLRLFELGYPLVSVIPPEATLSPGSTIAAGSRGKAPGKRFESGVWGGYNWLRHEASREDVMQWINDGANFGVLAAKYPALDIDSEDPIISAEVRRMAVEVLGGAPVRVGRAPKQLLVYRTDSPFARTSISLIDREGKSHLIEVLGAGRQYLVHGTHPSGVPYQWEKVNLWQIRPDQLKLITIEKVIELYDRIEEFGKLLGYDVKRTGDGVVKERDAAAPQDGLKAPSIESVREALAAIPNDSHDREYFVRVGYAVKAASQDFESDGLDAFCQWVETWTVRQGHAETAMKEWKKMAPPYHAGWGWLLDEAKRRSGFASAAEEFEVMEPSEGDAVHEAQQNLGPPQETDQFTSDSVFAEIGNTIRYTKASGNWYVWSENRWCSDDTSLVSGRISQALRKLSGTFAANDRVAFAKTLGAAGKIADIEKILRVRMDLSMTPDQFDSDPYLLNTPGGIVDLRTGEIMPADPTKLCSRITAVAPMGECPRWLQFLNESTGNDQELIDYLQRVAGYCLTGDTKEQVLFFIWGPGGNGKSVFVGALQNLLKHYAQTATMATFAQTKHEAHSTDIADLAGARMVVSEETDASQSWNESRVKALTGGGRVKARFLFENNFEFTPLFKLVFVGNHKPNIKNLDDAMRRRFNIIPFVRKPETVDKELQKKLAAEAGGILLWAIEGAKKWQASGLAAPSTVTEATAAYFEEQDAIGAWLKAEVVHSATDDLTIDDAFDAWREWQGAHGERVGSMREFKNKIIAKGYEMRDDMIAHHKLERTVRI